ncbi:MAG: flagellar protein [Lachnospiraceae bacterium]|nr:flagellar protein [Lachnospiraceae bacterium]
MNINNSAFLSNLQIQEAILTSQSPKEISRNEEIANQLSFNDVLKKKLEENRSNPNDRIQDIMFSKHAMNRLESRNISLTDSQMDRLNEGARKAGEKGIKESLVLVDELAFIVNVSNKTVVTAMDKTSNEENIFTNIDGAVIA